MTRWDDINRFSHPREAESECCRFGCNRKCWCYTLCPCSKEICPAYTEIDCCYCKHEYENGLMIPNTLEISGTWCCRHSREGPNSYVPQWLLVLRIIFVIYWIIGQAVHLTTWCINDRNLGCVGILYYPMYLTNQINTFGLAYMCIQIYITCKYRKYTNEQLLSQDTNSYDIKLFFCNKILLQISLVGLLIVVVQYYFLVNPTLKFDNFYRFFGSTHTHGTTFVIICFNFIISYQHIYYKSSYYIILYGFLYWLWLVIHYLLRIGDADGKPYVYSSFDFGANASGAVVTIIGVLISSGFFNCMVAACKNCLLISKTDYDKSLIGGGNGRSDVELAVQA